MAIEDEIINITDIDVGTEILKNDKLLIETSNGTKLLAFKDFVVGPDNISSVRESQVERPASGPGNTETSVVTGLNILTNGTTPGISTKYSDISGTVELGKFNYNAIANLASVSADIAGNYSAIRELARNLDHIAGILEATDSTALNSVVLSTSACNCIVTGATGGSKGGSNKSLSFTTKELDPVTTNPHCTVELDPFKLIFPKGSNDGFIDGSRFMLICQFDIKSDNQWQEEITIYKKKADGTNEVASRKTGVFTAGTVLAGGSGLKNYNSFMWTDVITINIGDELTATANNVVFRGKIDIFKIS